MHTLNEYTTNTLNTLNENKLQIWMNEKHYVPVLLEHFKANTNPALHACHDITTSYTALLPGHKPHNQ